jgi:hypothetical protein
LRVRCSYASLVPSPRSPSFSVSYRLRPQVQNGYPTVFWTLAFAGFIVRHLCRQLSVAHFLKSVISLGLRSLTELSSEICWSGLAPTVLWRIMDRLGLQWIRKARGSSICIRVVLRRETWKKTQRSFTRNLYLSVRDINRDKFRKSVDRLLILFYLKRSWKRQCRLRREAGPRARRKTKFSSKRFPSMIAPPSREARIEPSDCGSRKLASLIGSATRAASMAIRSSWRPVCFSEETRIASRSRER